MTLPDTTEGSARRPLASGFSQQDVPLSHVQELQPCELAHALQQSSLLAAKTSGEPLW